MLLHTNQGTGYRQFLPFEDTINIKQTHLLDQDSLHEVHGDEDQKPEFVFAIGKHTGHTAQAFVEGDVPHVVAVKS